MFAVGELLGLLLSGRGICGCYVGIGVPVCILGNSWPNIRKTVLSGKGSGLILSVLARKSVPLDELEPFYILQRKY